MDGDDSRLCGIGGIAVVTRFTQEGIGAGRVGRVQNADLFPDREHPVILVVGKRETVGNDRVSPERDLESLRREWQEIEEIVCRLREASVRDQIHHVRGVRDGAPEGDVPANPHQMRSEEHTSELQSHVNLVCRLLLEKKKKKKNKKQKTEHRRQ